LPALALHLRIVFRLGVERLAHENAVRDAAEADADLAAVVHRVLDQLLRRDARVRSREIEPRAAVLRLHSCRELSTLAQIDGAAGRVPVVGGGIPLLDGLRVVPGVPHGVQVCLDGRLDGDLHETSSLAEFEAGRTAECKIDSGLLHHGAGLPRNELEVAEAASLARAPLPARRLEDQLENPVAAFRQRLAL